MYIDFNFEAKDKEHRYIVPTIRLSEEETKLIDEFKDMARKLRIDNPVPQFSKDAQGGKKYEKMSDFDWQEAVATMAFMQKFWFKENDAFEELTGKICDGDVVYGVNDCNIKYSTGRKDKPTLPSVDIFTLTERLLSYITWNQNDFFTMKAYMNEINKLIPSLLYIANEAYQQITECFWEYQKIIDGEDPAYDDVPASTNNSSPNKENERKLWSLINHLETEISTKQNYLKAASNNIGHIMETLASLSMMSLAVPLAEKRPIAQDELNMYHFVAVTNYNSNIHVYTKDAPDDKKEIPEDNPFIPSESNYLD